MKVGTICYAVRQGIGWLPKWFHDHGIVTDVLTFRHGSRPSMAKEWYPPGTVELVQRPFTGPVVEDFIRSVDVMLFFETPFDWSVLNLIRKLGKRSVIVPMHECTPERRPAEPDKWICPSLLDQRDYFPGSPFLEIPVDASRWRQRERAVRWLHDGGHLGLREHKGTRQILQALRLCKEPVDFTVRAQDTVGFLRILNQEGIERECVPVPGFGNLDTDWHLPGGGKCRISFPGENGIPHDRLYVEHDAFIMAEKYNGLSLPLREARAAGMLVVTSDRFPTNTWLPFEWLIPVKGYSTQKVGGPYLPYLEAELDPAAIAATIDRLNNEAIDQYSLDGLRWAQANSWEALKPAWLEELAKC